MKDILERARAVFPYTSAMRREFHSHPELGFQEFQTAEIILREFSQWEGFSIQSGIAQTGIMARLVGEKPGKTILVRFDMDALPVNEETGAEYSSRNEGVMHACGHDGHMAIGLTVARLLSENCQDLAGEVVFLFQPAEEGLGGAVKMIEEGVLDQARPDYALGIHLWNEKPVGWLGISPGPVMSASETFRILIRGKGGHGGMPHDAVDPIVAAAAVITTLQTLSSREVHPLDSSVISVCTIHAGNAPNVIPGEVSLSGTIRTFRKETRELVLKRFQEVVTGVASTYGCQAEVVIDDISPAVVNHPEITAAAKRTALELFPEAIVDGKYQTMASEDMAFFLQEIPGCYCFIGSANPEKGLDAKHHQPDFDYDEGALSMGVSLLIGTIFELLKPDFQI
jgi:amidohydrolase